MSDQAKSYLKNFALLFTGNSVSQVIPFLLAPFICRIFSPEEIAVQENFLAIVALVSIVAAGRFEIAFLLPKIQKKANNLFALSVLIAVMVSFAMLLTVFFKKEIAELYNSPELEKYIFFLSPAIFLITINNIIIQWILRSGTYFLVSASRVTQAITQNGGYILLGYWGWGITGLIIAWIIGNLIPVLLLIIPALKRFSSEDVSTTSMQTVAKEYKDFPMINSLHSFIDILATQFLIYMIITQNYGGVTLGLFAIMSRYMRAPFNLIGTAVGQLYYREASIAKNENLSVNKIFNKSLLLVASITIPAMIIIYFYGPEIFALYLGDTWKDAGTYASIMAPALLFNILVSPLSATPLIYNKQKTAFFFSSVGHAFCLAALYFPIQFGYDFSSTLAWYSASVSLFYLGLLIWYRILINSDDKTINA